MDDIISPVLGDGVRFLGEIDAGVRDPLLRDARATLMLGAWPEPFGLVAIESLAMGTPVMARRAGALPEIIEHGIDGFLVDDIEEAVLAVRLVGDLDRRAIRARALERFGRERMVEDYLRVYAGLLAAHDVVRSAPMTTLPTPGSIADVGHAGVGPRTRTLLTRPMPEPADQAV